MNEEYLWDRQGEPDAEVARLEELLGELRWTKARLPQKHANGPMLKLAAAAIVVAGIGAAIFIQRLHMLGPPSSWQLSFAGQEARSVRTGQVIETAAGAGAKMESKFTGEVNIDPSSRLRVLSGGQDGERLALDRGTIHALIWAPPTRFVVDTPSAKTVDLGCQYTL